MTDAMEPLRRDFMPCDLSSELTDLGFDGSIAVQARRTVEESHFLLDLAEQNDFIRGVVGWVDFESDELDEQLEFFSRHRAFKGVRELIHDMHDVNYACRNGHLEAIRKLQSHDLTYDLLLRPQHLLPAWKLARQFPNQSFVIDHIAKPDIANQARSSWQIDIERIAELDNVYCKLSGMVTEATWQQWIPTDFLPYLEIVLSAFGANRLMIGSDWPVCLLSGPYRDVMSIVIDFTETLTPDEQAAILGGTCAQFYNLEECAVVPNESERLGEMS